MANKTNSRISLVVSILLLLTLCTPTMGKTIYVDDDAIGANDGSSWLNAYKSLQDALADANSAEKPVEIRVAQGIYRPDLGGGNTRDDREATFNLINNVIIKGGFAGIGEPDPNARDVQESETILSGDIGELDHEWDNCYHVVTDIATDYTAVLDGFTITAGADWRPWPESERYVGRGAGIYNKSGSPTVTNCTFTRNWSATEGGGVYNDENSSPTLTNCTFSGNSSLYGGGMFNDSNSCPTLRDCNFTGNWSDEGGGGIYNWDNSSPMIINCTISGNTAGNYGGGMYNDEGNPILTNCIFSANSALGGGGIYNEKCSPALTNCTFSGNTVHTISEGRSPTLVGGKGGGMFNVESSPTLTICAFIGNIALYGGGMYNYKSDPRVINCMFSGNSVWAISKPKREGGFTTIDGKGGGIYNSVSDTMLTNCTFAFNSARNGNALACSSSEHENPSNVGMTSCIVCNGGNEIWNEDGSTITINYSDVQGGQASIYDPCEAIIWGEGNIDVDPCFAKPGYWDPNGTLEDQNDDFWVDGDYHLKSQAGRWDPNSQSWIMDDVTSPCINAGDPNSPVGDEPIPNGGIINMGAYGGTTEASMSAEPLQPFQPLAHWKLDETEGDIAYDSAGDNEATVHGAVWTEGKIDGALQFDGFNDYVDCGDSEQLGSEQMTFSMWLKPEHMGGMRYIVARSKKDSDDIDYAIKRHLAGEIEFSIGQLGSDPVSMMSQANTPLGEWSQVAVCLDGSQASIYINGQRDSSASYTGREAREDYWLVISSIRADIRFYNGLIDDVRIYDQALSDEEIGTLAR